MPALLAVGLEGFWGLVLSAIALPILGVVRGTDGLPLDSATQAFQVSLPLLFKADKCSAQHSVPSTGALGLPMAESFNEPAKLMTCRRLRLLGNCRSPRQAASYPSRSSTSLGSA